MRRILRILLPMLVVALVIVIALSKCNPNTPIVPSSDVKGSTNGTKASSSDTDTEPRTTAEAVTIEFKPTATGIYVARDGSIRTAEITEFSNDGFEQARYDEATLRGYIADWVDSYNNAKGKDSVRIETIEVKDGMATLILYYDSLNAFIDFQGEDYGITSLRVGTAEYAARNFALSGLKDAEGNTVTPIDALQDEDVTVVAVSGSSLISFAGEVKFLSGSLTLVDANTVRVSSKSDTFIIFK
ncbi:MAG: hypothetical protein IJK77_03195 [Lachnospiraceae bacterium]|nr:hypothetical protein [Lachnospiraceae bacterium]